MKRFTTVSKKFKKIQRHIKKTFSKKKNQRKAIYTLCFIVIIGLATGLAVERHNNVQVRNQLKAELSEKKKSLETVSKDIQELKEATTIKDAELEKKTQEEARLKAEIEKKEAELQAKREAELTLANSVIASPASISYKDGDNSGNTYVPGNCTWYAKNKRPDLPNRMGNARNWYSSAKNAGYATGTNPKAGAIGVSFNGGMGHVVYIESVSGGQINISEMNAVGLGVVSSRVASAGEFVYIY